MVGVGVIIAGSLKLWRAASVLKAALITTVRVPLALQSSVNFTVATIAPIVLATVTDIATTAAIVVCSSFHTVPVLAAATTTRSQSATVQI